MNTASISLLFLRRSVLRPALYDILHCPAHEESGSRVPHHRPDHAEEHRRMNRFDGPVLSILQELSQRSWTFDNTVYNLSGFEFLKGGVVVAFLWALWFSQDGEESAEVRKTIVMTVLAAMGAVLAARLLAAVLPFRPRPMNNPELVFLPPFGVGPNTMRIWTDLSSFPSDHATLFSALSAGMFFVSFRAGLLATAYTVLLVLFPRVYLGMHYPTDILGGAVIGVLPVLAANRREVRETVARKILAFGNARPGPFYGISFLVSYQTAELFQDLREIGTFAFRTAETILHRFLP